MLLFYKKIIIMKIVFTKLILIFILFKPFTALGQIETSANSATFCNSATLSNVFIPIDVKNMNGIKSISLTLNYDNTVYTYTGYDNAHSSLNGGFLLVNDAGNSINIAWFNLGGSASISDGTLLRLKFTGTGQDSDLTWDTTTPGACEYSDLNNQIVAATYTDALPNIDLGNDVITPDGYTILDAGSGFTNYLWSTGQTSQTIQVINSGIYNVTVTDANGCSNIDVIDVELNLPVELASFEIYNETNGVSLKWMTLSEIDNKGFEIEKSIDGYNWELIGFVNGNDNSNDINKYTFIDNKPNNGDNYYKLKQIDFSGRWEYSNTVNIYWKSDENNYSFYPNPSFGNLFIDLDANSNTFYSFEIFDTNGKFVGKEIVSGKLTGDTYRIQTKLTRGVYFIHINERNNHYVKKIIIY
jgi:hypothetical protein